MGASLVGGAQKSAVSPTAGTGLRAGQPSGRGPGDFEDNCHGAALGLSPLTPWDTARCWPGLSLNLQQAFGYKCLWDRPLFGTQPSK